MFEANVIQLQPCDPYKDYIVMSNHTYPDIGQSILLMPLLFRLFSMPMANSSKRKRLRNGKGRGWAVMPVPSDSTFFFSNILFAAY